MPTDSHATSRAVKQILIVVAILLALIIVLQNTQVVTFRFLFWSFSMSQILLIPLAMLIGFVIGLLTYSLIARKKRRSDTPAI